MAYLRPTDRWQKDEMELYTDGYLALAQAVVKQWAMDGRPAASRTVIDAWVAFIHSAPPQRRAM